MIPRGGWRLTLRDLDGNIVQTESIEHPDEDVELPIEPGE